MAREIARRTRELTATTGTGTYTLAGAVSGHRAFSATLSDGDTVPYCIVYGTDYEIGIGTYTASGTTLARTTIRASSNSGSAVDWPSGDKEIWCAVDPADVPSPYIPQDSPLGEAGFDFVVKEPSNEHWQNRKLYQIKALTDGATITVDQNVADVFAVTLGGNRAVALNNPKQGQLITLLITQDETGSRLISNWPTTVKWAGDTTPELTTTANKTDVIRILCVDATTPKYLGYVESQNHS